MTSDDNEAVPVKKPFSARLALLAAAAIASSQLWLRPVYFPYSSSVAIGSVLLAAGIVLMFLAGGKGRRTGALCLAASLAVTCLILDEFLTFLEGAMQWSFGAMSAFAYIVGKGAGVHVALEDGNLLASVPEGTFVFHPSSGSVGFRLFVMWIASAIIVMGALGSKGIVKKTAILGLVTIGLFGMRYAAHVLGWLNAEDILADRQHAQITRLSNPWTLLASVATASVLGASLVQARMLHPPIVGFAASLMMFAGSASVGWALALEDPGVPKRGRVLIDDRLSGFWEPSGRLLTKDRYGDFSTYSFASMTEHLARRYAVTVNHEREYERAFLEGYDVLILKVLHDAIPQAEQKAIVDWVHAGGGLMIISDHTDLAGMSTYANEVLTHFGMLFRFDSVTEAAGDTALHWKRSWMPEHPVSAGLDTFTFLTGCSIDIWGSAKPVMTASQAVTEAGDYSRSSNFGQRAPNPSDDHGRIVVAAAACSGRGRVLAFSDSTVLSSFSYYRDQHDEFVARSIAWLNRTNERWWSWLSVLGLTGAVGLVLLTPRSVWRPHSLFVTVPLALLGLMAGVKASKHLSAKSVVVPEATTEILQVGIVAGSAQCVLPPVLGSQPDVPQGYNLSTFVQLPQRLGAETAIVTPTQRDIERLDAVLVLNPDRAPPPHDLEEILSWVKRGGRLVVTLLHSHVHHGDEWVFAYAGGHDLQPEAAPLSEIKVMSAAIGSGKVIFLIGSEWLDTQGLGHCMAYPNELQRKRMATVYFVLEELAGLSGLERRTYVP